MIEFFQPWRTPENFETPNCAETGGRAVKWGTLKKVRGKAPQFPLFLFSWVASEIC